MKFRKKVLSGRHGHSAAGGLRISVGCSSLFTINGLAKLGGNDLFALCRSCSAVRICQIIFIFFSTNPGEKCPRDFAGGGRMHSDGGGAALGRETVQPPFGLLASF